MRDSRGRSAGRRLHWLDASAVGLVVLALAATAVGYVSMRGARATIDALDPPVVQPGAAARLRLRGRDLRPFLQAYIVKAGERFVLNDPLGFRTFQPATLFFVGDTEAEIECPELAPGSYDIYLFDLGRQVAMRSDALRADVPPGRRATLTATVRFYVPAELGPLLRAGDRDRQEPQRTNAQSIGDAVIRTVAPRPDQVETFDMRITAPREYVGPRIMNRVVDATLTVPVVQDGSGVWTYKGEPMRAGDDFTLGTDRYVVRGLTLDVSDRTPAPSGG